MGDVRPLDPATADAIATVRGLTQAGRALAGMGDPSASLIAYQKAALLAQSLDDPTTVGRCLVESAEVLTGLGEFVEAVRFLVRARDLAKENGLEPLKAEVYRGYGTLYKARGQLDEAAVCFDRALARVEFAADDGSLMRALMGLCEVYLQQGRAGAAGHLLARARSLDVGGDSALAVRLHLNLGRLAYGGGDLGQAVGAYEAAAAAARAGSRTSDREVVAVGLAGLYLEAARVENALDALKEALALSILAFAKEQARPLERARLAAMRARLHEIEAKVAASPALRRALEEAVRLHDVHPLVLTGGARPYGALTVALEPRAHSPAAQPPAGAPIVEPANLRSIK